MSEKSQIWVVWWGLAFTVIFALAWVFLLGMTPPPSPTLGVDAVAQFYQDNATKIKLGAVVCSWVSASMVPITAVLAAQVYRLEIKDGPPIWAMLTAVGGGLMSMFLVFPPILWGVAAFTPERAPETTYLLNQIANLTLTTTDQFYIFFQVAVSVVAFRYSNDPLTAFPRWYAYFNLWVALLFEVGAFAFLTKTGPFAWDGLLVFWMPFVLFFTWIPVTCFILIKALKRQLAAKEAAGAVVAECCGEPI